MAIISQSWRLRMSRPQGLPRAEMRAESGESPQAWRRVEAVVRGRAGLAVGFIRRRMVIAIPGIPDAQSKMTPMAPHRRERVAAILRPPLNGTMIHGASAPPIRLADQTTLAAPAHFSGGNQRPMQPDIFGYAPASPILKRVRMTSQRGVIPRQAGQTREDGPPGDDAHQGQAITMPIAHGAAGNLKQAVGHDERAQHPTPLLRRKPQVILHHRSCHGDAYPVEVSDDRQERQETENGGPLLHFFTPQRDRRRRLRQASAIPAWAKSPAPMNRAASPSRRSMRSTSFHFTIRTLRLKEPTFNWPALVATARWAMKTSSVSPPSARTRPGASRPPASEPPPGASR